MKVTEPTNLATEGNMSVSGASASISTVDNLVDTKTLKSYIASDAGSGVTITIDLGGTKTVDLVALANLDNLTDDEVTIALNLATVEQASETVEIDTPVQQTYAHATFDSVSCDEVTITFASSGQFELGYLFVGAFADYDVDPQAFQISWESADPVSIARAGNPQTSTTYIAMALQITLKKLPYADMKTAMLPLLSNGYGNPVFWLFDEECLITDAVILATLDAGTISLDPILAPTVEDRNLCSTTIGLLEVF